MVKKLPEAWAEAEKASDQNQFYFHNNGIIIS